MLLFNVVHFVGLVCDIPAFKYKTVNLRSRTLARKDCVKVRQEAQPPWVWSPWPPRSNPLQRYCAAINPPYTFTWTMTPTQSFLVGTASNSVTVFFCMISLKMTDVCSWWRSKFGEANGFFSWRDKACQIRSAKCKGMRHQHEVYLEILWP